MTPVIRLLAVPAVMLDGFMQFVIRLANAALAIVTVISECPRGSGEASHFQKTSSLPFEVSSFLHPLVFAPTGMGMGPAR
jgi:hypothetical protein